VQFHAVEFVRFAFRIPMQLLFRYLSLHRRTLVLALVLATVNQVFSLMDPQIFRLIVDQYAMHVDVLPQGEFISGVLVLLLASMGVALASRIAKNFQDYFVNVMTQRIGAGIYGESIAHAFSLPYGVFEDQRSGEILQKLQKARADTQVFVTNAINIAFLSLLGIGLVLVYAAFVHWSIALSFMLMFPIVGGIMVWTSRRIKAAQAKIVKQSAELAGSTTETLRNVELVKSLGLEAQESERLNDVNVKILGLELAKVKTVRLLNFIQGTTINTVRTAIMFLMLWLMSTNAITLGEFFSLLFYSFAIFNPLYEFGQVTTSYQEARASMEQVERLLAVRPEPKPAHAENIGRLTDVAFAKVDFSYAESSEPAVRDITLRAKAGESIAFVGPSGSGKTTLVKLLVGLYRPIAGQVLVNGVPGDRIDYETFRSHIGYVSQETQLFAGTIRENLLFVRPNASDKECLTALGQAAALSIIERGEKGLDTKIGEGGIKISGGERQRLAIARALLRDPELIIFDEATSSLDSLTERAITETIRSIAKSRQNLMSVSVAHRLSTVAHADRIYVLAKGTIVEEGGHKALLARQGLYAALWKEQSAAGDEL
jgi:ATP-binding cassette subfamily B protein